MNTLFEGMDEGELISYLGLLQQVQGLLDGGMTDPSPSGLPFMQLLACAKE